MKFCNESSITVNDVEASLQYGNLLPSIAIKGLWACLIVGAPSGIGLIIGSIIERDDEWLLMVLIIVGLSCIFISAILYCILRNSRLKKLFGLWLSDAVFLNAYSSTVDSYRYVGAAEVSLLVKFQYLNKKHALYSGKKGKIKRYKPFKKYADRKLLIAYSPKYDQVMLLKPESEQRILAELAKK